MTYIFISYSRSDSEYAHQLANFLESEGFDIWIDGRGIDYGDRWWRTIVKAIENCAAFIVIMTPESEASEWVEREILLAQRDKKPIYPLLLKGREFALLITTQYVSVTDGNVPKQDFLKKLDKHFERQNQQGKNVAPPEVKAASPPTKSEKIVKGPYLLHAHKLTPEKEALIDRLLDLKTEPPERLQIGMRLAELGDPRVGVGLDENGLPEFDWVTIPAGDFIYGDEKEGNGPTKLKLPEFKIAKYPVTYQQFQAFIDAKDGFHDERWWQGLAGRDEKPGEPRWKIANHPREIVSWYDAVAFCRWLSHQFALTPDPSPTGRGAYNPMNPLTWAVRLPTEQEWEKAARGTDGRNYPWGKNYISGYANVDETYKKVGKYYLQQTTAAGVYPQGASPYQLLDMSGNVWEWTLNEVDNGKSDDITNSNRRAPRGGSWLNFGVDARVAVRFSNFPNNWFVNLGFRVCLLYR